MIPETSEKSIDTLVSDIQRVLTEGIDDIPKDKINKFGKTLAFYLTERLKKQARKFSLRLSNIGKPCTRQLWYEKWKPEEQEKLSASNKLKFLFGDLCEELILFLAEITGHRVEGRQDKLDLYGIKGSRDVILDGRLADVKSASSASFKKFQEGLKPEKDAFGYLGQLGGYHKAGQDDDLMVDKKEASFVVFDKQHGHLALDTHTFDHENIDWEKAVSDRKKAINNPDVVPDRGFEPIPDGYTKDGEFKPNGSMKLGTNCSYCASKFSCHPNLRVFISASGPRFYTEIKHKPKMLELTKEEYLKEEIDSD